MSAAYWYSVLGPASEPAENVKVGAYVLCASCSRGVHTNPHTSVDRCACDLPGCGPEENS